jgi:hypothetical protein
MLLSRCIAAIDSWKSRRAALPHVICDFIYNPDLSPSPKNSHTTNPEKPFRDVPPLPKAKHIFETVSTELFKHPHSYARSRRVDVSSYFHNGHTRIEQREQQTMATQASHTRFSDEVKSISARTVMVAHSKISFEEGTTMREGRVRWKSHRFNDAVYDLLGNPGISTSMYPCLSTVSRELMK